MVVITATVGCVAGLARVDGDAGVDDDDFAGVSTDSCPVDRRA